MSAVAACCYRFPLVLGLRRSAAALFTQSAAVAWQQPKAARVASGGDGGPSGFLKVWLHLPSDRNRKEIDTLLWRFYTRTSEDDGHVHMNRTERKTNEEYNKTRIVA